MQHDRNTKFTRSFDQALNSKRVKLLKNAYRALNTNAYVERFIQSLQQECLDKLIVFGAKHCDLLVREYVEHYHAERNHQGLENKLIDPVDDISKADGEIICPERLGGMLKFYHRKAA